MNSDQIIALAAVVTSGVVSIASLGFNFWNSTSDRKQRLAELRAEHDEQYRIGLYEKRLEVYQRAFSFTQELGRAAFRLDLTSSSMDELGTTLDEFRTWLASINLYLDPISQRQLSKVLLGGREVVLGRLTYSELSEQVERAQAAILKGIALKHIDFEAIKDDLREMREATNGT